MAQDIKSPGHDHPSIWNVVRWPSEHCQHGSSFARGQGQIFFQEWRREAVEVFALKSRVWYTSTRFLDFIARVLIGYDILYCNYLQLLLWI